MVTSGRCKRTTFQGSALSAELQFDAAASNGGYSQERPLKPGAADGRIEPEAVLVAVSPAAALSGQPDFLMVAELRTPFFNKKFALFRTGYPRKGNAAMARSLATRRRTTVKPRISLSGFDLRPAP